MGSPHAKPPAPRSRLTLAKVAVFATVIVFIAAGAWYGVTTWQAHQLGAKLGWTPDQNKTPGSGSTVKPISSGNAPLQNDVQLPSPSPTPEAAPGQPDVTILLDGDHMNNWGMTTEPGQSSRTVSLGLQASNLNLSACSVTDNVVIDDLTFTHQVQNLLAVPEQSVILIDGLHTITVSCAEAGLTRSLTVRMADRQPKLCKGYIFTDDAVSAGSLDELKAGLVGTWKGCVYTPWVPPYYVTLTFNADGTYDSVSDEIIDGQDMVALYWGADGPDPLKKYSLTTYQNSLGSGTIDLPFPEAGAGASAHDSFSNIKLMGEKLSFNLTHFGNYGPVQFKLTR